MAAWAASIASCGCCVPVKTARDASPTAVHWQEAKGELDIGIPMLSATPKPAITGSAWTSGSFRCCSGSRDGLVDQGELLLHLGAGEVLHHVESYFSITTIHTIAGEHQGLDADERLAELQDAEINTLFNQAIHRPRAGPPHTYLTFLQVGVADVVALLCQGNACELLQPGGSSEGFGGVHIGHAGIIDITWDTVSKVNRGHMVSI